MFQLLVVSAVLAVTLGQTKYCCTPDQWEGYLGEVEGSVFSGQTHLVTGNISISYDYTNTRMATSSFLVVDGKIQDTRVITNFKTKMIYTIVGTHCTANPLLGNMKRLCIPDSATPSGKFTYGLGKESLDAMAYLVPAGQDTVRYVTTTVGNPCVPIGDVEYGSPNQTPMIQTKGYYNISPGIKDPNVFIPPSSCTGIKHLKSSPMLANKLMNHIHNQITKN